MKDYKILIDKSAFTPFWKEVQPYYIFKSSDLHGIKKGDELFFIETKEGRQTGKRHFYKIDSIKSHEGLKQGYLIASLRYTGRANIPKDILSLPHL